MDERFSEYFSAHADELTNDLAEIIAINSVGGGAIDGAPYGEGPRAALSLAAILGEKYGFRTEIRGDRMTVIEYGPEEPELGILAHLDVVPPAGVWEKTQPFDMLCEDGILYGRGVADDKGPAIAALYALRAVKELGVPLKRGVQIILGSDEERGSSDVAWYRQHYNLPPKVFTPDAEFPVVNTEKGHLEITVTAPGGSGKLISLKGGSVANAVPAECTALISSIGVDEVRAAAEKITAKFKIDKSEENTEVTCIGKASHASRPEGGVNAVAAMLELLSVLPIGDGSEAQAIRALSKAIPFGDNGGHAFGAYCEDEESGDLTVNLGVIDYSQKDGLRALIDCRVPICGSGEKVAKALEQILGGRACVTVTGDVPAHSMPGDSDFVQTLLKVYEDYTGNKGETMSMGGLTYVHGIPGGVAFGCGFPGTEYRGHEPDERMPLGELLLSGVMFAQVIADICG